MDVYWKRDPFRTIINTRYNNHLSMESNTTFQSQHDIRQSLANSQFFSSFDLSSFYDQILSCPTSSLINTVLYQGQELAMTIASMGARNSCLWASAVVLSLLHHHTDELLLQPWQPEVATPMSSCRVALRVIRLTASQPHQKHLQTSSLSQLSTARLSDAATLLFSFLFLRLWTPDLL